MKMAIIGIQLQCGGVEEYAIQLYKALKKYTNLKVDFYVLNLSGKPHIRTMTKKFMNYLPLGWNKSDAFRRTHNTLSKYDLLQFNDCGNYQIEQMFKKKGEDPPYFYLLEKLKPKKILGFQLPIAYLKQKAYPFCEGFAQRMDGVFSIGKRMAKANKTGYLPQLISLHDRVTNIAFKLPIVISTARVVSFKGQMFLLRAANNIKGEVRIYGYGNTRYSNICREEPNYKIKNVKNYKLFINKNRSLIYSPAKVLVNLTKLPPELDGDRTEYTLLEGMKYGCVPIVHKDWCGETFRDDFNVLGVDRNNPDEIMEACNYLLESKDSYEKMVNNNFELLKQYSAKRVIKKYLNFYKEVLDG